MAIFVEWMKSADSSQLEKMVALLLQKEDNLDLIELLKKRIAILDSR